jgi:TolB-like protein/DNA-binding winged helix-turn-helix (wHTH) protein
MMASEPQAAYEFGEFTLVPTEKRLMCESRVVPLAPKAFDTLVLLVENQGRLIQKDDLLKSLWPGSVVEEQALAHNVSQLRKALGDPAADPKFIETVPKRGYRFIAPVRALGEPARVMASPAPTDVVPSATRWSRPTVLAVLAGVLMLGGVTATYTYLPRAGPKAAAGLPAVHSLAVLPLENLSGDKEQEYFADGMTGALIADLAQIRSLRVISRTSAMHFKGSKETLPQIGRELQVDAVVEGAVVRRENRVRITAQLIEVSSDQHLWARTYERDLKDTLGLQDEIARDITEQIRIELTPKERGLLMHAHAVDPEAQDAYLRGRYWNSEMTPEGARKALAYFQKAIAKDPNYAVAYAGVAESFNILGLTLSLPLKEAFLKQKQATIRALQLDPSLADAHVSLAQVKWGYDWDWSGAEDEFKQAIALEPNYALGHMSYSGYLLAMGRVDDAVKESERSRDLDPFSIPTNWWLGQTLYHARRYDDALRQDRRGLEMYPDSSMLYHAMADVYEQEKMFPEAFAARQQALRLLNASFINTLDAAYRRSGYRGYLLKSAQNLELGQNSLGVAHIYALLDDEPRAIAALERAYEEHNTGVLFLRTAPELDSIRSSPRFRDLVRRIGFPPGSNDKN